MFFTFFLLICFVFVMGSTNKYMKEWEDMGTK